MQLAWMLFLKIMDDKDQEQEILHDDYVSPVPTEFQWRNWAANSEGPCKSPGLSCAKRPSRSACRTWPTSTDQPISPKKSQKPHHPSPPTQNSESPNPNFGSPDPTVGSMDLNLGSPNPKFRVPWPQFRVPWPQIGVPQLEIGVQRPEIRLFGEPYFLQITDFQIFIKKRGFPGQYAGKSPACFGCGNRYAAGGGVPPAASPPLLERLKNWASSSRLTL